MPELALDEPFERHGEWSIPDRPEQRVAGSLTFSGRRVDIELNEALTPIAGDISVVDKQPNYPLMHGTSTKGELLSVLHASRAGISFNFGPAGIRQPERVISSWLIVGAHVEHDQHYTKVRFVIPGLAAWLALTPVTHILSADAVSGALIETFIRQAIPPEVIEVPSIGSQIEWGAGTSGKTNPYDSIAISVQGWLCIKPAEPKPIEWFFEQHSKLATLLAFIAGTAMPPRTVSAYIADDPVPLSVLVAMRAAEHCKLARPGDFFLPRHATKQSLEQLVSSWFSLIDSVLAPSQLASSTLSSKDLWLHVQFASLIQSLEGFRRGRYTGMYMEEIEYEKVKSVISNAIPSTLPSDHKDALRSRIKYGNQISLNKRLSELATNLGTDLAKLILGGEGKVPRTWIDTRNYHSHWDEELLPNTLDGQEMYSANVRMEHFIRSLFLMLAGVRQEEIVRAMSGTSSTAQQLVQINIIDRHRADPLQPKGIYFTVTSKEGQPTESNITDDSESGPEEPGSSG